LLGRASIKKKTERFIPSTLGRFEETHLGCFFLNNSQNLKIFEFFFPQNIKEAFEYGRRQSRQEVEMKKF
jgi:hypothetical protein